MHGHESEILTTTFLMLSAVSFGLILRWLKQPPLVGYILAGLALGPAGLGQSRTHAGQLTVGVLVAQDIAVVPMLVFAQSGIDVLQQWPLLLVRVVIALVILAALLVWIGKTAHQRLPMAVAAGRQCRAGNSVQPWHLFSGGKPDWLYWIVACIWRVLRRIGACPYKFTQSRFGCNSAGAIAIACGVFRLDWAACRSGICQKPLGGDCWCDLWCSVYQNPSWMGAFNHWRRAGGTGACVIACHPTNRRIQLCFDNKRGRIGHLYEF